MAKQQVEIAKLDQEAADAFDRYQAAGEKKRTADATARKQKDIKDEACGAIIEQMGDSPLGRLPDGRLINRQRKVQDRKAQPAHQLSWWELTEVE